VLSRKDTKIMTKKLTWENIRKDARELYEMIYQKSWENYKEKYYKVHSIDVL
jgi:hypothetical protein